MHNLGTVFGFEVIRTLKKKSFWITAIAFPLIAGVVFAIIFFSNKTTSQAATNTQNQHFTVAVTDRSGTVDPRLLAALHATSPASKQQGIDDVKAGRVDAYFYYPHDLTTHTVQVYAKDVGLFDNSRYQAVAKALLQQSAASRVDAQTAAILKGAVNFTATTYRDGHIYDGIKQLIAPGIFLVLFYILIVMFGNQMLTSTTEEKENRVIEMILTTIQARTLIIGKILSLLVLALIQICIILVPLIAVYLAFGSQLSLPSINLAHIPLDPVRIVIGALVASLSFLFFTGLLVAIGSATPTAKEASSFFGIVMMMIFGPLYAVSLFISAPESPLVRLLSFFPFTAPIPLMLRNAVGNLTIPEALLGIAILAVSAVIALSIAVRMFRYGALEYSRRLSLAVIFRRQEKARSR